MLKKILLCIGILSICLTGYAEKNNQPKIIPHYNMQQYDQQLQKLYQTDLTFNQKNIIHRIEITSHYFLGEPYQLEALGEGPNGEFDKHPLYRTDAFDCMTYVSTVLALAESKDLKEFQHTILKVQYRNAVPLFVNRNHVTSVDWNPVNQRNHFIYDMNDKLGVPTQTAVAIIDKPNWYRKLSFNRLVLFHLPSLNEQQRLLEKLHQQGDKVKVVTSRLDYIALNELFKKRNGKLFANQKVFSHIPSGTIVEIVRANWNLKKMIGTNLNVAHMGFAIRTKKGLMFREASSEHSLVIDVPLAKYLVRYYRYFHGSSKVGIHLEAVM